MSIKILFMGTPEIAVSMFEQLLKDEYQVIGVVTQPDKRVGRKQEYQMSPVKLVALAHNIPVYQPIKIKDDYQTLMELDVDLIVTCAYGQFIPELLLQNPTFGSINVHASLLPKLRGGAPIHKAIINGDKESGVSIMRMVAKMDAGAVLSQCHVNIEQEDTMGSLYEKLAFAGATLLSSSIPSIIDGSAKFIEQDEEAATFAFTIQKEEEWIDFYRDVQEVYNHIRGLLPSPCGYARLDGKKIKFHKVRMIRDTNIKDAGKILGYQEHGFAICAYQGMLVVDEIQMEGKAKSDAKSFYNGVGKMLVGKYFDKRID